jgi:Putative beta-barrel porin 2
VHRTLCAVVVCCALSAVSSAAYAQDIPDPEDLARIRFGPIRLTPSVTVTSLGVDTNVFNEADDPKQDTTAAFGPRLEFWMRVGRARLSGSSRVEYVFFKKYDSQRSFGTLNEARLELPLNRLAPFVEGRYTNTRQRPGYEIDARARRREVGARAGADLRVGSRSTLRVAAGRDTFRFDSEDSFLGAALSEELDRDSDTFEVSLRQRLTPLTTLAIVAEQRQDRFVFTPVRDADGFRVTPGFEFKPFALVQGSVFVGYRRFRTLSPIVPDFAGPIATADLAYALRATRFQLRLNRDVTYSFETLEPYYLLTDVTLSVTQRITQAWDVVGRGGRQLLDYRAVGPDTVPRTDKLRQAGGGVGYRFGEQVRLGVDADHYRRQSVISGRTYQGWRIGGSVNYGVRTR